MATERWSFDTYKWLWRKTIDSKHKPQSMLPPPISIEQWLVEKMTQNIKLFGLITGGIVDTVI